jgi:outer membrane protein assembly factor BamE (lipoprotein component of BamABCDE complex)
MKILIAFIAFVSISSFMYAQPCKQVKTGMTADEVLKLVGKPTEVNSLGSYNNPDGTKSSMFVWQYGEPTKEGNQRVEFLKDEKVTTVIADGKKYDELMIAFKNGEIPKEEISDRIEKLNKESCK